MNVGLNLFRGPLAGLVLFCSLAAAAVEDPQQLVRETGDRVLAEVSARKAELEADPKLIYPSWRQRLLLSSGR